MELRDALFAALRYELAGVLPEGFSFDGADADFLGALYHYANRQEVAHLVGDALERLGVLENAADETAELYRRRMAVAAYHAEQQRQVFEEVKNAFENAEIPYLPLKGLVIRPLYPEPWMRTAGDLDILVKDEDLARAEKCLLELGARRTKEGKHDISYFFPTGVMIELHYQLLEDKRANGAKEALEEIWQHTERVSKERVEYRMEGAWLYYYHLVHAAKHLQEGTCGIRPFLDLWVIEHNMELDAAKCKKLLAEQGLSAFANEAEKLSKVWLGGGAGDEWTTSLEAFLLAGGTFGSEATKRSIKTAGKGRKLRYYFFKVFLPYAELKVSYPMLERYPILFPFLQIKRWFRILFCGGLRKNCELSKEADRIDKGACSLEALRAHLEL